MTSDHSIQIVPGKPHYAGELERLYRHVYGDEDDPNAADVFTAAMFRRHLEVFPEGQFVALDTALPEGEQVIGLASSMRLAFDLAHPHLESWYKTTGDGWLTTHDPNGEWLYGVESCVHADYRGQGVGGKLIDARFDLARRLNLRGMVAGSAPMGYHRYADTLTIEEYMQGVVEGRYFDINTSKQLRKGFRYTGVLIPNYIVDQEARGWGALIVWDNPSYSVARIPEMDAMLPPVYSVTVRPHHVVGRGF
jgi:GNAT superfamily N-acetyltransferase